ncbi:DUF4124 domain-containing protein [Thiohalophilus sp.]|uniref:DUF4124 domain-containing protein n=1 Tax=Thiohalophilus sp. TaxID=3028392 RepID=UPI002ACD5780|nr:DUF4124 domain-containing protein [Thiohalophilus sp.]MDZ7663507.1 DUF4124 domain-containing protein [Thiohalophilus sp.]
MKKALLILLGLLLGAGLYLYTEPDLQRQARQQLDKLTGADQSHRLYRWQDAEGQWQVTDQPPPVGTAYETLQYDPDTNVIPSENLTEQKQD